MAKWTLAIVVYAAISWMLLLLPWVQVEATVLTGAELSDILALLPALGVLILLISLYGRFSRILRIMASLVFAAGAYISFTTNFSSSAASIALQESITGIAGDNSLGQLLATPVVFGFSQLIASLLCLGLLKKVAKRRTMSEPTELDARGIWEEQS